MMAALRWVLLIAMTAGLAWVAGRKPTPVPGRADDRKRR